jgi:hypothetical protein
VLVAAHVHQSFLLWIVCGTFHFYKHYYQKLIIDCEWRCRAINRREFGAVLAGMAITRRLEQSNGGAKTREERLVTPH